jgi:hypothetical protein
MGFLNIRDYFVAGVAISLIAICIALHHAHNKIIRLKAENQSLLLTIEKQKNINKIINDKMLNDQIIKDDIQKQSKKINNSASVKDLDDFMNKSDCIFNNFTNEDTDCN